MIRYLTPQDLAWHFTDKALAAKKTKTSPTKKVSGSIGFVAQDRALKALELGLGIRQKGYNIFVVGATGTGRTSTIQKLLKEESQKEDAPEDIVLLYNFDDKDRPLAVCLPTSVGAKLKKSYDLLMERVISQLEKAFDSDHYIVSKQIIDEECRQKTDDALKEIEKEAKDNSFVLSHTGVAITLTPAGKKGEALSQEEFERLTNKDKQKLEQKAEYLEGKLEESMRKVRAAEKESDDAFDKLERDTASRAIAQIFETQRTAWKANKRVVMHLNAMEEDILNRIRRFINDERSQPQENPDNSHPSTVKIKPWEEDDESEYDEPLFLRYRVNVLVTQTKTKGSPVVFETHPTSSNLIGRIEQRLRGGETITDFTRIRAGALYRANGGYLVMEAAELLRDPSAWDGLKRALKNRAIELDDPGEPGRMVSVASLRPEPVPLNIKIILIGTPELYYALTRNDPDFLSLFKVKADFDSEVLRTDINLQRYLTFFNAIVEEEGLLPLDSTGKARLLEQTVRLSGNKNKLTCRLGEIADLLREANFCAKKEKSKTIASRHIKEALNARASREGFVETQIMEEITTGKIKLDLSGKVIGQTNALTVVDVGNYEFGIALRVTCQTSFGKGEIIDIEREAEQSGPFHSKGRLIIRGLLSRLFGQITPFAFHATLCMEQTYSEIDGDSASLAEACALLSTLAQTPLDQRFAMTGAIDQMGHVQAVGGINEKIEGFFKVCQARSSSEVHAVLIPERNVNDIMLAEEVVEACKKGNFKVVAADTVEDALSLLTGIPWDGRGDTLKNRCLATLEHFNAIKKNTITRVTKPLKKAKLSDRGILVDASL